MIVYILEVDYCVWDYESNYHIKDVYLTEEAAEIAGKRFINSIDTDYQNDVGYIVKGYKVKGNICLE